ncbi:MAG: hypothetical protein MUC69_06725 [Gemmatimonadales bacterium]|jgi:hypothetical protein|nr:hypothetical protein [Gemmatimonadales bacterium]
MTLSRLARGGATALLLALAACTTSEEPAPFNPDGAATDVEIALGAFASPTVQSFGVAADDIDEVFSGSLITASSHLLASTGQTAAFGSAARRLSRATASLAGLDRQGGVASVEVLPPSVLGLTFVFDPATERYVASTRTGAPANGVRFVLYTVNPVTGEPAEPLQEVGYADIVDEGTASTTSLRTTVVSGGTTYLDYRVDVTAGLNSGVALVDGFVTNGVDRVNFDLRNEVRVGSGISATLDYLLAVPTRDVTFDWQVALSDILSEDAVTEVDLQMAGPHGDVRLAGEVVGLDGVLAVTVNGEPFALVTVSAENPPLFTDPNGNPLTPAEQEALRRIFDLIEDGADVFEDLLDPIDDLY